MNSINSEDTKPLTQTLPRERVLHIPPIRRLRNALLQDSVRQKIASFIAPPRGILGNDWDMNDRRNSDETTRRKNDNGMKRDVGRRVADIKILSVVTLVSVEGLIELTQSDTQHTLFIIHEGFLMGGTQSIRILQQIGYTVSFVADDWRSTGKYIIEKPNTRQK